MQRKVTKLPANVSYFHSRGIKDHIQKKAYRNPTLSRIAHIIQQIS
ncbi:MAG: hypothetical protein ACMUEL_07125 [Flavobacteriales bacterium Tduv]